MFAGDFQLMATILVAAWMTNHPVASAIIALLLGIALGVKTAKSIDKLFHD
jgi:hypothetical protein